MRIASSLLLLTLFFIQTLKSQDYQLVNSAGYKLFEVSPHPFIYGENNDVKSIKVDSIKLIGNDSILFLNKELQFVNNNQC